eukprot:scaffold57976_cov56-Attheya_sp.AAC.3
MDDELDDDNNDDDAPLDCSRNVTALSCSAEQVQKMCDLSSIILLCFREWPPRPRARHEQPRREDGHKGEIAFM